MKYYIVDAFTDKLFRGNPAGVCLLESELPDRVMQKIAYENNLAETAFLLKKEDTYSLRWFTPEAEMDLCGHATLSVERADDLYTMNFPSRMPLETAANPLLEDALGCKVLGTYLSRDLLVLAESEKAVENLRVDVDKLAAISKDISFAVIVTAKGSSCDFVSRFFAPNAGICEDPVTGSAHCTLIPFWSRRLGKNSMTAKQLSPRGGMLLCEDKGERVNISGKAVCYLEGDIMLPDLKD